MVNAKTSLQRRCQVTAVLIALLSVAGTTAAQPVPCRLPSASTLTVQLAATLGGALIDAACQHVYVTNTSQNRVEVFSLASGTLEAPIPVGSRPVGLDVTPDGALLYVANSGGANISVVDLAERRELRRIIVPSGFSNDTPYSIAIASNGLALFSTTFAGSGFGGRLIQLDLATDAVTQRTDFWFSGTTTERTRLRASGDRGTIGIVAGDISSGPVFRYSTVTNGFSAEKDLNAFVSHVSLDRDGTTLLVTPGAYVLDRALNLAGTIPLEFGSGGNAIAPDGRHGYRAVSSRIDVLDLFALLKTSELPLGDTVDQAQFFNEIGGMAISADGTLLAVVTDHGFSLVRIAVAAPVDITPPTLTLPADISVPATTRDGARVSFVVTATDDMDPHPTVNCTPSSDSQFPIGTTTVTCTAVDASSNSARGTFRVHVLGPFELLEELLDEVLRNHLGPGHGLANKLRKAIAALVGERRRDHVCRALREFAHEVREREGKHIASQEAASLLNRVDLVRLLVGCESDSD